MPPRNCRVCKESESSVGDTRNFFLTCRQCDRSWHHRCHQPRIPENELIKIFDSFLVDRANPGLGWSCSKCSRKKPVAKSLERPPSPDIMIIEDGSQESALLTPHPHSRPILESEIIDLTETPGPGPGRVQVSATQRGAAIAITEPSKPPPPLSKVAEVIDLPDSPEFVALQSLEPLLPYPTANLPELLDDDDDDGLVAMDVDADADADGPPASAQPNVSASPSLSELGIPGSPTPEALAHFPSMEVEDMDQKPNLFEIDVDQKPILHQSSPVPNRPASRPQGGSLAPAWIRERYDSSGQMALWKRSVRTQIRTKPLSRRKPEKTARLASRPPHPLVVLYPFDPVSLKIT